MKIYNPLEVTYKTQGFGESKACRYYIGGKVVAKKNGVCPMGSVDLYESLGMKGHNGEDWIAYNGQPIYFPVKADCEWWVRNYRDNDGGLGIDVFSDRPIDIGELPPQCGKLAHSEYEKHKGKVYVKFRFHHILKPLLSDSMNNVEGKPEGYRENKVKFGQAIALADNTGLSSGAHLHWSMKVVQNNSMTVDSDNGFYGAVDFSKYFTDKFVLDEMRDRLVAEMPETQKVGVGEAITKVFFQLKIFLATLIK